MAALACPRYQYAGAASVVVGKFVGQPAYRPGCLTKQVRQDAGEDRCRDHGEHEDGDPVRPGQQERGDPRGCKDDVPGDPGDDPGRSTSELPRHHVSSGSMLVTSLTSSRVEKGFVT